MEVGERERERKRGRERNRREEEKKWNGLRWLNLIYGLLQMASCSISSFQPRIAFGRGRGIPQNPRRDSLKKSSRGEILEDTPVIDVDAVDLGWIGVD